MIYGEVIFKYIGHPIYYIRHKEAFAMHGRHGHHHCHCDMRGMLSFLILFLLSKKPMCGRELTKEIGRRKGSRPSPGTIYPALKALKEAGLIKEKKTGKIITYSLTEEGRRALAQSKRHFCRVFIGIFPAHE